MAELMVAITHMKKCDENVVEQLIYLLRDDYRRDFDREIESKIKRTLIRLDATVAATQEK